MTNIKRVVVNTKSMVKTTDADGNEMPDYCGELATVGPKLAQDYPAIADRIRKGGWGIYEA